MMPPGSFLLCLLVCFLEKGRGCAEIAKELKAKQKKSASLCLLHPKIIYLPASIVSQEREHLPRAPPDLRVSCRRSLPSRQRQRQCRQLLWFVCVQGGYTRPVAGTLERSLQFQVFCVFATFPDIYLVELASNRSSNSISSQSKHACFYK